MYCWILGRYVTCTFFYMFIHHHLFQLILYNLFSKRGPTCSCKHWSVTCFLFLHRCSGKFGRGLVREFLLSTLLALSRPSSHGTRHNMSSHIRFLITCAVALFDHHVPQWREFAKEMDGVIRIGAVNCGDNAMVCRSKGINSYPSLYVFRNGMVREFRFCFRLYMYVMFDVYTQTKT